MKMKDETYNFLKWMLFVLEPALITLISSLGIVLKWETELIITIIGFVSTFVGSVTGISSIKYKKESE